MKKLLLTLLILGSFKGIGYAKPGGWIKDFFQNNQVTVSSGYYPSSPVYYTERPIYYYQAPVVYERPVYYCPPPRPRVVPMQPYQNHYHYYR
jgi:hypothetical protein